MGGSVRFGVVVVLLAAGPAAADEKPRVAVRFEGHRGGVGAVAFHPKGELVATGAGNGVLRVWNVKTGEVVSRLADTAHGETRVTQVAFSGEGAVLSSASKKAVLTWDVSDPKLPRLRHEDGYNAHPAKTGTVAGDGKRVYYTAAPLGVYALRGYVLNSRDEAKVELPEKFRPVAVAAIPDAESGLVAVYGATADDTSGAVALIGLGDPKVLTEGVPVPGKAAQVAFSSDGKWLVVGNGDEAAYWRVPGGQVITGKPTKLKGGGAAVAAGPGNRVAVASTPEEGKKATVTIYEVGAKAGAETVIPTDIERVSVLAFSPDGTTLAVGDDAEGVLQLWAVEKK